MRAFGRRPPGHPGRRRGAPASPGREPRRAAQAIGTLGHGFEIFYLKGWFQHFRALFSTLTQAGVQWVAAWMRLWDVRRMRGLREVQSAVVGWGFEAGRGFLQGPRPRMAMALHPDVVNSHAVRHHPQRRWDLPNPHQHELSANPRPNFEISGDRDRAQFFWTCVDGVQTFSDTNNFATQSRKIGVVCVCVCIVCVCVCVC